MLPGAARLPAFAALAQLLPAHLTHAELLPSHVTRGRLPTPAPRCIAPAGSAATGGVLLGGLIAFKNGKSALAQHFMRARVVVQGVTVAIMLGSGGYLAVDAAQQRAAMAAAAAAQKHP